MEKRGRKLYNLFAKWSLSYIFVSAVAIIVIAICSWQYSKALREELEYINAIQLEMTQLQMDQNVNYLREFCKRAYLNKTVAGIWQEESYEDVSRYDLYMLVQELGSEIAISGGERVCYLYFPQTDLLLSNNNYNDSGTFYDMLLAPYGFSYEDWYRIISGDYRSTQIFTLETGQGESLTAWVRPLDSRNRRIQSVNAIMIMDLGKLLEPSRWLNTERDFICILDRDSGQLVSNLPMDEAFQRELLDKIGEGEGESAQKQFRAGKSVVSYIPSQYENWDYVVITQENAFVTRISELQKLVILLVLFYLLVSAVVIVYAAAHHYRPLQNVVDVLARQEGIDGQQADGDTYEYISKSVHRLVNKNRESRNEIIRQHNAISRELLHRLLTENKAPDGMDEELLKQYGILVGGSTCCILAYRTEEDTGLLPEETLVDGQEIIWFILQNVTEENALQEGLKTICFREGRQEQIFLMWTDGEDKDAPELKAAAKRVQQVSAEFIGSHFKFPYRTALSEPHGGVSEIYRAYQEVTRVFEYQRKESDKKITSYGEINLLPVDTLLKYPIDVENRLAHSVSMGDEEGACREIRLLLDENQANCLVVETLQFLVIHIASDIFRMASKSVRGELLSVSNKALMEACQLGDAEKMQEALESLVKEICQSIKEYNQIELGNQKGTLCQNTKDYVEKHYSDAELSVNFMAERFGVQSAYLSKIFREMEGGKLSQYISRVRLLHAKKMILEGAKLEDIAMSCGFGSQRTFLRSFKQYEGVTPSQYKELEEKRKEEQRKEEQDK